MKLPAPTTKNGVIVLLAVTLLWFIASLAVPLYTRIESYVFSRSNGRRILLGSRQLEVLSPYYIRNRSASAASIYRVSPFFKSIFCGQLIFRPIGQSRNLQPGSKCKDGIVRIGAKDYPVTGCTEIDGTKSEFWNLETIGFEAIILDSDSRCGDGFMPLIWQAMHTNSNLPE